MPPPPKNTFTSNRLKALKKVFDKYDQDGSGELDEYEVRGMLNELGLDPTDEDIDRVMSRADKDGNRTIGFDEFSAGCLDEGDSNVYSGIRRIGSSALLTQDTSTFLDLRKKRGASRKVWTKNEVEKIIAKPEESPPEEKNTLDEKKKEVDELKKVVAEAEKKLRDANEKLRLAEAEFEKLKQAAAPKKEDIPSILNAVLKHTQTANDIAKAIGRDAKFSARIFKDTITGENLVEVNMKSKFGSYFWSLEKFMERYAEMLNMHEDWKTCKENGEEYVDERPAELDPFQDTEYQMIGQATAWLKSLGNMMESTVTSAILNAAGNKEGDLIISINPCDSNGNEGPWDDDDENDPFVDSPEDLIGQDITFKIKVPQLRWIGQDGVNPYDNTYIRYKFNADNPNDVYSRSDKVKSNNSLNQEYNYEEEHHIHVDDGVVKHLMNGRIIFEVWGHCVATHSAKTNLRNVMSAVHALAAV